MGSIPQASKSKHGFSLFVILLSACLVLNTGCSAISTPPPTAQPGETPAAPVGNEPLLAEVTFTAELAAPIGTDSKIYINILDEVTGLALNPQRFEMTAVENGLYTVTLPFQIGSVVKYRFSREGSSSALEYTPMGAQVRYRMFRVDGPSSVHDLISAWNDLPYSGKTGRITGQISASAGGDGLPPFLVTAAGIQTITDAGGAFVLEGVPPGIHNLVVYPLDGSFETFQQGASVEDGKTTPAQVTLAPSSYVNITFNVAIPVENVVGLPVRLAGSLYQTGNTFADLDGGLSVISTRMPLLNQTENGRYSLTLALPAGADFRYKYSLGDGFWNSEQAEKGGFVIRQLIIPDHDVTIEDSVVTWHSPGAGALTFSVKAPESTPAGDFLSIQFNPYGWTEPIPMWDMGSGQWLYILYSPLNLIPGMDYRYCRNGQCAGAAEINTGEVGSIGRHLNLSAETQSFQDTIAGWSWWNPDGQPSDVLAADITPRGSDFIAGVEFQPVYNPSIQLRYVPAFQSIRQIGANWVVIDPTWSVSSANPPILEADPGRDPLFTDVVSILQGAAYQGLQAAVFPSVRFEASASDWWGETTRDVYWWDAWFSRYKSFLLHYADAAAKSDVGALILGGDWILPALPDGRMPDGTVSDVPGDAGDRWLTVLDAVHQHYSGPLYWAASYADGEVILPAFINQLDGVYLMLSSALTDNPGASVEDLTASAGAILDDARESLGESASKPVILAVEYASASGSASSCILESEQDCVPQEKLARPNDDLPGVILDLQEQVDIYNALFAATNTRGWITGFVSRGYYYPAALQDKSASVHGKPAQDVIWYWFPGLTAQ